MEGFKTKKIKTKSALKQTVLPRVRSVARATAVGAVKVAKDKVQQTVENAVNPQGQENESVSAQASSKMLSDGSHIAALGAQKTGEATAAVYRFAKRHKAAKNARQQMNVEPLADIASPFAADMPAPQADIKTRPTPETFTGSSISTDQPPSPKVRFTDDAAPSVKPVSERTSVRHVSTAEASPSAAPIKQRAAQNVKAKQAAGHETANIASPQAGIKTRPVTDNFAGNAIPAEQAPSTKMRFSDDAVPHTMPVDERAPVPQVSVAEATPPAAPIKQRAAPSVKTAVQTIKTKDAADFSQKSLATYADNPHAPRPVENAAVSGADTVPTTQSPRKRIAEQLVKSKENALLQSPQPTPTRAEPQSIFGTQADAKIMQPKQSPNTFRTPQEIIKTKSDAFDTSKRGAHISANSPVPDTHPNSTAGSGKAAQKRIVKTREKSASKTLARTIKQDGRGIKTASQTAAKAKQAARAAQKTAQQTARAAKAAAQKAVQAAKVVVKAVVSAIKAFLAALQSLVAAIAALGGTALMIILIISLVAILAGSVLGIFMAAEPSGHGTPVTEVTSVLNEEYYKKISEIQAKIQHDKVEIRASDGVMGVKWEDVLAIYACKLAASDTPMEVVTFDEPKKEILRGILWDMNAVNYTTRVETKYIEVPVLDEDGNQLYSEEGIPLMDKEYYTETTLIITVEHKTTDEIAAAYGFTPKQYEALALLKESDYASLWATLLGGLVNGSGEIITPDTDWTGTDIFSWPLPKSFSITSRFGYRKDPFTGEISYHSGTDIAAPYGTPILAAAGGTVTVANATDPWGYSYGYHVKINHGGGQETLYAHCSTICVTAGQNVQAGEVIGYVGSTGASTGNHLHFEVRINGKAVDGLGYFQQ